MHRNISSQSFPFFRINLNLQRINKTFSKAVKNEKPLKTFEFKSRTLFNRIKNKSTFWCYTEHGCDMLNIVLNQFQTEKSSLVKKGYAMKFLTVSRKVPHVIYRSRLLRKKLETLAWDVSKQAARSHSLLAKNDSLLSLASTNKSFYVWISSAAKSFFLLIIILYLHESDTVHAGIICKPMRSRC